MFVQDLVHQSHASRLSGARVLNDPGTGDCKGMVDELSCGDTDMVRCRVLGKDRSGSWGGLSQGLEQCRVMKVSEVFPPSMRCIQALDVGV